MTGREGFQRKPSVEDVQPVRRNNVIPLPGVRVERKKTDKGRKEKSIKPRSEASMLITIANRGYKRAKGPETMAVGVTSKAYRQAIDDGPTKREQNEIKRLEKLGFKPRKSPAERALLQARAMASAVAVGMMGGTGALSEEIRSLDNQQINAVRAQAEHLHEVQAQWNAYRERYAVSPGGNPLTLQEASPRLAEFVRSQGGAITLGNLFVSYLGSSGSSIRLQEGELVSHYDPVVVLENLWNMKCMIAPNARGAAERAVGGYRSLVGRGEAWRSTIDAQIEGAQNPSHTGESITDIIATHLDWNALQREYRLSDPQRDLLKSVVAQMSWRNIYSIFLTELMPSDNGAVNIAVADTMLRRGGEGALVRLTSLGDPLNSSTPGQFTFYSFTEWEGIPRVGPLLSEQGYRLLQIPKGNAVNRMPNGQLIGNDSDSKFGSDLATSADQIESIRETEVDVMFNGIGNLASTINSPGVEHFLNQYVHGVVSEQEYNNFFGVLHHQPNAALAAVASFYRHHYASIYDGIPEDDNSMSRDYIRRLRGNYSGLENMRPAHDSFAEGLRHPPEPLPH